MKPEGIENKKGFDYFGYIESFDFGEYKKVATDLAELLASPLLQISGDSFEDKRRLAGRKDFFDAFCAVCVRAKVEVPELEPNFYMPLTHADSAESAKKLQQIGELKDFLEGQMQESAPEHTRDTISSMLKVMALFPDKFNPTSDFGGISTPEFIAAINQNLVAGGLKPIRPDYEKIALPSGFSEKGPKQESLILIVDDDPDEIIRSALKLVGWPNLKIKYHRHVGSYTKKDAARQKEIVDGLIAAISEQQPKIVLMDQGLEEGIEGSQVTRQLLGAPNTKDILVVGNTGGEDSKLLAAGAFPNFNKGRSLAGLRRVVQSL